MCAREAGPRRGVWLPAREVAAEAAWRAQPEPPSGPRGARPRRPRQGRAGVSSPRPGSWWTSGSEALAQAPSRQALACWRVDRASSSPAVVGTVLYALTETWKVRRPATKSSPGPRGGFRKCPSRPSGLALGCALPGGGVLPPSLPGRGPQLPRLAPGFTAEAGRARRWAQVSGGSRTT